MKKRFWNEEFCTESFRYYRVSGVAHPIGSLMMIYGGLHILMSLITISWIKRKEYEARHETKVAEDAAKSVIFPVFVQFLWLSIIVNIMAGLIVIFVPLDPINQNNTETSLMYSLMWAAQHVVIEGIAFLLMQKGCGQHAARQAARYALLWGILTFLVMYYTFTVDVIIGGVLAIFWDCLMLIFYLALWHAPEEKIFRRPAAVLYAKFWSIYRFTTISVNILIFFPQTDNIASCGVVIVQIALFAILQPLVCYWTLLKDSRWWQGLDFEAQENNEEEPDNIRAPLIGSDFSLRTAQSLADTMDRMRQHGRVKMLNFACIKVNFQRPLGAGSFSKVYKGSYRSRECAIKLIYTVDLTTDVIKRVAAEASILSAIRHPNIVDIIGVSVLPPSVCLILELCSFGSLSDIIRGYGFDWNMSHKAPLHLSRADMLYLALGCAKGIAAVHAYDPTLCHRDVKSFNFLVDAQLNVKIADLELGTSDTKTSSLRHTMETDSRVSARSSSRWSLRSQGGTDEKDSELSSESDTSGIVVVEDLLANWMAPEVIRNRRFQQASDVYSLGTVLWEIFSKQLPFEHSNQPEIRQLLVSGYTHPIPDNIADTPVADIIQKCWLADTRTRPSAEEVAARLETLLFSEFCELIPEPEYTPNIRPILQYYMTCYRSSQSRAPSIDVNDLLQETLYYDVLKKDDKALPWWNIASWLSPSRKPTPYKTRSKFHQVAGYNRLKSYEDHSSQSSSQQQAPTHHFLHNPIRAMSEDASSLISDLESDDQSDDQNHNERLTSVRLTGDNLSSRIKLQAQMPKEAHEAIRMIKQEKYWSRLEMTDEAWAILSTDSPHIVLHATSKWYEMFDVPSSFGSDYHLMSLLGLISPEVEVPHRSSSHSNNYVQRAAFDKQYRKMRSESAEVILDGLKTGQQVHGVLCMHLATNRYTRYNSHSAASSRNQSRSVSTSHHQPQLGWTGHNLMVSLHAYPVYPSKPSQKARATTPVPPPPPGDDNSRENSIDLDTPAASPYVVERMRSSEDRGTFSGFDSFIVR